MLVDWWPLSQVFARFALRLRYWLDRARIHPARARELLELRRRLVEMPDAASVDEREVALAKRLMELRKALGCAFRDVSVCRRCTRPASRQWPGGQCCGGNTSHLFTKDELAALKLGGTRPSDFVGPDGPMDGCAFRTPNGCSLDAAARPILCLRYACPALERELRQRKAFTDLTQLRTEVLKTFSAFVAARCERLEREVFPWDAHSKSTQQP